MHPVQTLELVLALLAAAVALHWIAVRLRLPPSTTLLAAGGVAVGLVAAAIWLFALRRLADETLNVAAGTLLCWASYLAGKAVHVSGVIATVTAGIVFGWTQHVILPASVRLQGGAFWRTLVFILEAPVLILIGFSLRGVLERVGGAGEVFTTLAASILGAVLAVTAARFAWVFGSDMLLTLLRHSGVKRARPLGWRQTGVLGWAGMRGVATLAVALTPPEAIPGRDLMLVAAFAVILITVVIRGGSLGWLIRRVRPVDEDPPAPMDLPQIAAGRAELSRQHRAGLIEDEVLHDLERDLDLEEMSITFQRGG